MREVYEDSGSRSAAGAAAYPTRPPAPADSRAPRGDDAGDRLSCALYSPDAATVDPVRLARRLLEEAEQHRGARIFGQAAVQRIEPRTDHVVLHRADEHRVRARSRAVFWETARPYLYVRETADGRVLVGGQDIPFRRAVIRNALVRRARRGDTHALDEVFGFEGLSRQNIFPAGR